MAIIVELSGHEPSRYSRRFDERCATGAEILLFTGVRYERTSEYVDLDDVDYDGAGDLSEDCSTTNGLVVEDPKSVG